MQGFLLLKLFSYDCRAIQCVREQAKGNECMVSSEYFVWYLRERDVISDCYTSK